MNVVLVDTSHLLYRSHHTFSRFSTKGGMPTGIHFGVMRAVEHIAKSRPNAFIVFCLDGHPAMRKEFYPEYKANRSGEPDTHADIIHEFGVTIDIKEMVKAAGCAVAHNINYESDDIIAMLALKGDYYYGFPVDHTYVYSGDDDFCQLVRSHVTIWKPPAGSAKRGGAVPERLVGLSDIYREWGGLAPESLPLYRSFTGDSGDNIAGLARVPRERLQQAVRDKELPEQFYDGDGLAYFSPDWKYKLTAFRPQCERNFRVTKLPWDFAPRESLPIEFGWSGFELVKLQAIFEKLEFSSFIKKMGELQTLLGSRSYAQVLSGLSHRP